MNVLYFFMECCQNACTQQSSLERGEIVEPRFAVTVCGSLRVEQKYGKIIEEYGVNLRANPIIADTENKPAVSRVFCMDNVLFSVCRC